MATQLGPKMTREQLKPGESLCDYCSAKCCRYFALPIDKPEDQSDFDYLRWYLLHEHASAFIDEGQWYLLMHTTCKHLQPDHRCGIYETRPQICRDYSTENCEFDEDAVYERYFEMPEQVSEYVEALFNDKSDDIRSPRPPLLPIVG